MSGSLFSSRELRAKRGIMLWETSKRGRTGDVTMFRAARKHLRLVAILSFIAMTMLMHSLIVEIRCGIPDGVSQLFYRGDVGMAMSDNPVEKERRVAAEDAVNPRKRSLHRIEPDWTDDEVPDDNDAVNDDAKYDDDEDYYDDDDEEEEENAKANQNLLAEKIANDNQAKSDAGALPRAKVNDVSLGKEKYTDSINGDSYEYFRRIDQYQTRIDPHTYRYKLNPKGICRKTIEDPRDIFLLIFVNTAPGNFLKRVYMRETFGRESAWPLGANESMKMVFSVGATKDPKLQLHIYQESEMYGDIIQEDFTDHYWNMTLKSVMGFKWTTIFCRRAVFTMKMDDDVLLNTPLIYKILKDSPQVNFTLGDVLKDLGPVRDKASPYAKFYTPKHVYKDDEYPPFYGGSSYIMSTDVVENTYYMALKTPLIPWSDVFIGICFHKIGITPGHRHLFRQNARFHIVEEGEKFRTDDERITYLKQHMSMYHLTITQSKRLWEIWTEGLCKLQCVKPSPQPPKKFKVP